MNARKLLSAAKAVEPVYVEDVFQSWLRTGTGSSQTITTGVKENTGALVITKSRSAATNWAWYDTARGANKSLQSNLTNAQSTETQGLTSFNADGHTWGTLSTVNTNGATYVDYVLKPQPKFFDVVTYTGNGTTKVVNHSLGVTPGMIVIKRTNAASSNGWAVWHRSTPTANAALLLNTTAAQNTSIGWFSSPSSTTFTVNTGFDDLNDNGSTYVAYLFAHDAGGFGPSGTDNVISCGSFTTDGSGNATVNLGYEPQWVLIKRTDLSTGGAWQMYDTMRGMALTDAAQLQAQSSGAEGLLGGSAVWPTATGFAGDGTVLYASATYIYIAIRRGPMKVPTDGTKVYNAIARTGTGAAATVEVGFAPDSVFAQKRRTVVSAQYAYDKLRGNNLLVISGTFAEAAITNAVTGYTNTGFTVGTDIDANGSGAAIIQHVFRRAPGFFDVVCYTGNGVAGRTVNHNLGVAPEMMIVKGRTKANGFPTFWATYHASLGSTKVLYLEQTAIPDTNNNLWNNTNPSSSVFTVGGGLYTNWSSVPYVAYLFATLPGISKVGSYTGNGTSQTIDCGLTTGARFILIKRTDSTGDWYVWDSVRGIVAANDPHLSLNSTAAEVTTDDSVDPDSSGFIVNQVAATNINVNTATYIFLAIA